MGRQVVIGLVLAALLTIPLAQAEVRTIQPGVLTIGEDGFEVAPGDTLVLKGPMTVKHAPGNRTGRIVVWGALEVEGGPGARVDISVPIVLMGEGASRLVGARLWAVPGTALSVESGSVDLQDVAFEANGRAMSVAGSASVRGDNVTFRDHAGEAAYVQGAADVTLTNASFVANGRGATVNSASRFHVADSRFEGNGEHVVIDLGPWSAPQGDLLLARNVFGAPASGPASVPGILLRHDSPATDDPALRVVRLEGNRIEGAAIGLRAEGRGLLVESANDSFLQNGVGLSVQLATVRLDRPTLSNDRDVEGSGRVTIEGATYLRGVPAAAIDASSGVRWGLGGLALVALALLGLGLAVALRRPAAPAPAPAAPEPQAAPAPPAEPAPPAPGAPLTAAERRVLDDVAAHPGTAQRAVADRLGATRQAIHYHVKKLEARGLVTKTVEGRETRLTLAAGARLVTPVTPTRSEEKP